MTGQPTATPQDYEEAFRAALAHSAMLKADILFILRHPDLVEDTFSDLVVELARSWHTYDRTRPFAPWARVVARRVTLAALRRHARQPVSMDPEVLQRMGEAIERLGVPEEQSQRRMQLDRCLDSLSEQNRDLIHMRYFQALSYSQIAALLRRSINGLYVTFHRIHSALERCVQRALEAEAI